MKSIHNFQEKFSLARHNYLADWEEECEEKKAYNRMIEEGSVGQTEYQWTMNMLKNKKKSRGKGPIYPLSARQRLYKLRSAGVECIDSAEREEINRIKDSRVACGCDCIDGCLNFCACAEAGIPCQVERTNAGSSYPCSCGSTGCKNEAGRIEFDLDGIKSFVHKTIEKTRLEPEDSELLQPVPEEKPENLLFSILTDDENAFVKEDANAIFPLPEIYCSESDFQYLLDGVFPGCETYDCGCCKKDSNVELCPNCTCQPMDVAMTPEVKNEGAEGECDSKEEAALCAGCNEKPCIAITKMMTNFQHLAIVNDTCSQSTMTTPWPWYEDLEEAVTGRKGPSAMMVDPSNNRKRIYDDLDEVEIASANQNNFQKNFQAFVVNSRRKVSARIRTNQKSKVPQSNTNTLSTDNMPALVPLPELIDPDVTLQNKQDTETSRAIADGDFTALRAFRTFDSLQDEVQRSEKSMPCLCDITATKESSTMIFSNAPSSSSCGSNEASSEELNLVTDYEVQNDAKNVIFAEMVEPLRPAIATEMKAPPSARSIYSVNKLRPRRAKPPSHLDNPKSNKVTHIIKRAENKKMAKTDLSNRPFKIRPTSKHLGGSSGNIQSLCLEADSSGSSSSTGPATARTSETNLLTSFSSSADVLPTSNASFVSGLHSLAFSVGSKDSLESIVLCDVPSEKQSSSILRPSPKASSLTDLSDQESLSPLVSRSSSTDIDLPRSGADARTLSPASFLQSISVQSDYVFNPSSGIWSSKEQDAIPKNLSSLLSRYVQDIHLRISSSNLTDSSPPEASLSTSEAPSITVCPSRSLTAFEPSLGTVKSPGS